MNENKTLEFQGENKKFLESKATRKLLVGEPGSGKTFTVATFIHLLCVKYPGVKVLMTRKALPPLRNNAVKVYQEIVERTGFKSNVRVLGETRPTQFIYSDNMNCIDGKVYSGRSEVILSAIDGYNKSLGAEYDIVYINEPCCEGLTLDEFMLVTSRARRGHIVPRIIAEGSLILDSDGNKTHWIYELEQKGFEIFNSTLKDNPQYYGWTQLGKEVKSNLDTLPPHIHASMFTTYK